MSRLYRLLTYPTRRRLAADVLVRSTAMYPMHEQLSRDRMREMHEQAHRRRLSRDMASANRWQNLAKRAEVRHAKRAERAAEVSAVALAR